MILRHVEHRSDLALLDAVTDEPGIAAPAKRQREGIEQNGFARAGLAGQHRETTGKLDIEPFDQDDVTDRKTRQHAELFLAETQFLESLRDVGTLILARLDAAGLY